MQREINAASWKLVPVTGPGQYYVLVDNDGKTRAQGRKNLCLAVQQSYKFGDSKEQRVERLQFYGVIR